ncbi:MAG: S8 family peptidase [Sphingomonas sp.]
MRSAIRRRLGHGTAMAALLLVVACGGGSGGVSPTPAPPPAPAPTSTPTPTPPAPTPTPPAPTPTPAPSPGFYDTAEYRATVGAVSMHALAAYDRNATGAGVKVGVIDSGIDLQSAEFGDCGGGIGTGGCRISAASRDTAGNPTIDDEAGHGTAIAFTIAGRRNGAATHGVSFDATLVVMRADKPGSCATADADDDDSGCTFNNSDIAEGIDFARTAGARVINISLGGGTPSAGALAAMERATAAGVILVLAAGNEGDPNPDAFTSGATDPAVGHGLIVIAGSVGANDVISSFSNRAGTGQNAYLAAVGENVRAPDNTNTAFLWSGTSFSAPQISGAIALLAQAFPNLTGAEIVAILYASARDAGAAGTDPIYGRGILDLTRAFMPIGSMHVAGSRAPASASVNASLSAPMGDARQGPLAAVALDAFDRAYAMDLTATVGRQGPGRRLPALMAARDRGFTVGIGGARLAVTLAPAGDSIRMRQLALTGGDAAVARALAASVSGRLGSRAQFAIGASESGTALAGRLAGRAEPAFLVARDPVNTSGFDVDPAAAAAVRRSFGPWGVTLAGEYGAVLTRRDSQFPTLQWRPERFGYGRTTIGIDRRFGGLGLGLVATRLAEADTLLGARFTGALGAARADSVFIDLGTRWEPGGGWTLGGSLRRGWTFAHLRGGIAGSGTIRTGGFAADIGRLGVFGAGDRLGIRVAQPLRVSSGAIALMLPAGWDYASESVTGWRDTRINLAPRGREIDYEIAYSRPLWAGDVSGNLFVRRDPGHIAALPDDYGAAIRFTFGF